MDERVGRVGEDLQVECLARYGCVFSFKGGKEASAYWQRVWDWLRTHHTCIVADNTTDYPSHKDGEGRDDIELLNEFWAWQEEHYKGVRK